MSQYPEFIAFDRHRLIAEGTRAEVAAAVRRAFAAGAAGPVLAFEAATGGQTDFDPRESGAEVGQAPPRGRGRPRLGVVAREVTLLPRHWDWLAAQPGGASVALRRLVDEARRADGGATQARGARDAVYRFLHAIAGDLPGFEEAARALFAGDISAFEARLAVWPPDIAAFARRRLATADWPETGR